MLKVILLFVDFLYGKNYDRIRHVHQLHDLANLRTAVQFWKNATDIFDACTYFYFLLELCFVDVILP